VSVIKFGDCEEFLSGDGCILRELLSPVRAPLELRYSLAHAKLPPGRASAPHRLNSSEVYYILQGSGKMSIDGEEQPVGPTDTVYIPPGCVQHIANAGEDDLVFLCVVDPAWEEKDEEIL